MNKYAYRMQTGTEPLVKTAAHVTKSVVYNNREQLSAGLIVAGYDKSKGGQVINALFHQFIGFSHLYIPYCQVYVVPLGGMIVRKSLFAGGSGSIYIMGYLDATYRPNMTKQECLNMCKTGISIKKAQKL